MSEEDVRSLTNTPNKTFGFVRHLIQTLNKPTEASLGPLPHNVRFVKEC